MRTNIRDLNSGALSEVRSRDLLTDRTSFNNSNVGDINSLIAFKPSSSHNESYTNLASREKEENFIEMTV